MQCDNSATSGLTLGTTASFNDNPIFPVVYRSAIEALHADTPAVCRRRSDVFSIY
jgi:hypothetical protein